MAAMRFRDLANFERQADDGALDAYGNPAAPAWQALLEIRGNLRETTGKEKIAAGRLEAPATGTLRVRTSLTGPAHDITGADRVLVRGHTWKITGAPIDPDGNARHLEFSLERGGATE